VLAGGSSEKTTAPLTQPWIKRFDVISRFRSHLQPTPLMPHTLTRFLGILLAAAFAVLPSAAPAATIKVYFLGGQSNADGRGAVTGLPLALQSPQSDVEYFFHTSPVTKALDLTLTTLRPNTTEGTNQFGPEIALGRTLADHYAGDPTTKIAILKFADGGTNLHTQWKAGGNATATGDGPQYVIFQNTITSGLAALSAAHPGDTIQLSGMAWMQGESDTGANATAYQANLTAFISDIRLTYGANLPFAIGRLSDFQTAVADLNTIRTAQQNVDALSPLNLLINTDGFGQNGDNLHFNAAGQLALGQAFATALIAVPEPGTVAAVCCGGVGLLLYGRRRANAPPYVRLSA
jgi:hypothetical protein